MQRTKLYLALFILLILSGAIAAIAVVVSSREPLEKPVDLAPKSLTNHPVHINKTAAPQVATLRTNVHGGVSNISCATCHATTTPDPTIREASQLNDFHQGLKMAHGNLSCLSCHNEKNYDSLRLADGTSVPFENAMQLCAQCHGTQYRDYRNGAHGGMTGYWDLTKGPRSRNSCTDCHDAHAPAYPSMQPVFKPLPTGKTHGKTAH